MSEFELWTRFGTRRYVQPLAGNRQRMMLCSPACEEHLVPATGIQGGLSALG